MTKEQQQFFATCPRGLSELLATELKTLGAQEVRCSTAGVHFCCTVEKIYHVMLYTRLASAVLYPLVKGPVQTAEELYALVQSVDWGTQFSVSSSFKVDFMGTHGTIIHTGFGARCVKDAIVDQFQASCLDRPNVELESPDITVHVHLAKQGATVSLNLSGPSLHRRGYRRESVKAPLKENLAAAVLVRAGWSQQFDQKACLVDPMCGSGTLLIEAATLKLGIAPSLLRAQAYEQGLSQSDRFGFYAWLKHDDQAWTQVFTAAQEHKDNMLRKAQPDAGVPFIGIDHDARAVRAARANIAAAGLKQWVSVRQGDIEQLPCANTLFSDVLAKSNSAGSQENAQSTLPLGLVIVNPPYGERLGEQENLAPLYQKLGKQVKAGFPGWILGVFTGNVQLAGEMRLRAQKKYRLMNGPIASQLWLCPLSDADSAVLREDISGVQSLESLSSGSLMVLNRLKKNHKRLKRWREKLGITCYRLFDADMPEYACAVDVYGSAVHVQEYAAPKHIPQNVTASRFNQLIAAVSCFFQCPVESIACKIRQKQSGDKQYQRLEEGRNEKNAQVVEEGQAKLEVNLWRYLDTGLFLDHRPLRRTIFETARGQRFLNLFCYTASATVQAALGGASCSVSVDMSKTYLQWARRNFSLNAVDPEKHQLINADCLQWLQQCRDQFDMIMLDPPTFSNSKKMDNVLDIQRDHVRLITDALSCLAPQGTLYFSTNARQFKIDAKTLEPLCHLQDISSQTLDMDFERNPRIHRCWQIKHI